MTTLKSKVLLKQSAKKLPVLWYTCILKIDLPLKIFLKSPKNVAKSMWIRVNLCPTLLRFEGHEGRCN